jgi:hypothetical protein
MSERAARGPAIEEHHDPTRPLTIPSYTASAPRPAAGWYSGWVGAARAGCSWSLAPVLIGCLSGACANRAPQVAPQSHPPPGGASDSGVTVVSGGSPIGASRAATTPDADVGAKVIICNEICGSSFVARLKISGSLAALRASVVTACRNGHCASISLQALHQPHYERDVTWLRELAPASAETRIHYGENAWDLALTGVLTTAHVVFSMTDFDQVTADGCRPSCDANVAVVGFYDAHDGDVYDVTLGRPAGAPKSNSLHVSVQYQTTTVCTGQKCFTYEVDRRADPPWLVP